MSKHFDMSRPTILSALAVCMALTGCGGSGGGGGDAASAPPAAHSLGLMKITINGIGGQMQSHAEMLSGSSGARAHVALPTAVPAGLDVQQVSASTIDVGSPDAGGERYFTVVYQVRNAQFCATPGTCTAYGTTSHNLTLVAANTAGNIADTAISNISLYDGSSDSATQALAPSLLPTHGMQFNTGTGAGVLVQPGLESLQVFTEDEVSAASIPRDPGATDLFPYGYVVSNIHTPGSRALPANPANNQWDGEVSFSFKLPLQGDPKRDPYSITMMFQVIDDANTRVTESAEEQNPAGDIAADLRAATLGSVDLAVLGGRVAQTSVGDPICTVRTAGPASAPTATLANNAGVSLAAAPYGISGVSPSAPVNIGFCAPMNAAGFSSFAVSGSQSGTRAATAPYSGSYSANALNNILSFTPDQPFLPGETVSYTLTTGLTGSGGGALAQAFTGSYVVGGVVPSSARYVQSASIGGGSQPSAVVVGDFNGDGKPDFATLYFGFGAGAIQPQINNGDGTFTPGPAIGITNASAMAAGDFNGDGHLDLVVMSDGIGSSQPATFLLNDGSGNLSVSSTVPLGPDPETPVVGDFNGDGYPDVAVVDGFNNTVTILLNDGSGHFTAQPALPLSQSPYLLAEADFNGDGKLDLAVVGLDADGVTAVVQILFNNGSLNFTAGPERAIAGFPCSLAAGDLNGDGIADLVVGTVISTPDFVTPLYGDGKGGFTAGANLVPGGDTVIGILIGDFNGDGRADLAIANENQETENTGGFSSISLMLGDGKGGFSAASATSAGEGLYSIAAGDFNGDGRLDLVAASSQSNNVSIFTSQP